ncbi:MAG: ATP-binding protein [bacterium]
MTRSPKTNIRELAILLAATICVYFLSCTFDISEKIVEFTESMESLQVDEIIPSLIFFSLSLVWLIKRKHTNGTITGLGIFRNITERKKEVKERQMLEMEIHQARKLEAVGSLASGIAHEINTPIQFVGDNTNFLSDSYKTVMSLLETYEDLWQQAKAGGDLASLDSKRVKAAENADLEYLKEEVPSAIEQTLDGVQRVTKIVRAMKDFAHSDQGTKSTSDINDMLASCLTVSHNELKYVADVETDLDPELPDVECYRDDLNQVFLNLLINAAHTIADVVGDASAGKGTITVSTLRDKDNAIIKISDTGKGIPQSIRDRIFDPFFSTKDVGKGSGQGLSIARKIVMEKHKGHLGFETEEGKGTTFIIRLPITIPEVVKI